MRKRIGTNLCFVVMLTLVSFFGIGNAVAQDKQLSLTEILNLKSKIASLKDLTTRESPGIVTIITSQQIERSGANDLMDVLRTVPGFNFGVDLYGTIGLISRGMWTNEGKVLFTVDGIMANELAFGTAPLAARFPVEQIARLEVIRGPGSAIYGGFAGLNVINIVTKKSELQGAEVTVVSGKMKDTYGHNYISALLGKGDTERGVSLGSYVSRSRSSDHEYTYTTGGTRDLKNGSDLNPENIHGGFVYDGFEFKLFKEDYRVRSLVGFGIFQAKGAEEISFVSDSLSVKKDFKLSEKIKLTANYTRIEQKPFYFRDVVREVILNNQNHIQENRDEFKLLVDYDITEDLNIIFGLEKYWDKHQFLNYWSHQDPSTPFPQGAPPSADSVATNEAMFIQAMFKHNIGTFTAGVRRDIPTKYEATTVPRLAYTKVFDRLHFKLLNAKSFRSPNAVLMLINDKLDPEVMTSSEAEVGYQLTDNQYVSVNYFDIKQNQPLAYLYSEDVGNNYENYNYVHNQGFEFEYRVVSEVANLQTQYSYYQSKGIEADPLEPDTSKKEIFGAPRSTANLLLNLTPVSYLTISPSVFYMGKKKALVRVPDAPYLTSAYFEKDLPTTTLINLYIQANNLGLKGLSAGVGVKNWADRKEEFVQPYTKTGKMMPVPGSSRELFARLQYNSEF